MRALLLALALILAPLAAPAVQPDEMLDDPALEARARAISAELRCPVCRSESIDESNAAIARDLRLLVRERLLAGDSDAEVIAYVVDRYGDYVRFRPPFSAGTLLLWFSGPLVLVLGGTIAWRFARGRARAAQPPPSLTGEERARLRELTGD